MVESTSWLPAIENLARQHIKSSTLPDDAYGYIAKLVEEDCPRNAVELYTLIGDFLTDGMVYSEDEAYKICEVMSKILLEKRYVVIEQRDTIVADKLVNPVVLNQMQQTKGKGVIKDEDFLDPFTGIDKTKANQNTTFTAGRLAQQYAKEAIKTQDALDKKIAEFMEYKQRIPPPVVKHEKGFGFNRSDILVQGVTVIVGGKTLLEQATLKLVKGRKYGLVGRNGIGKTSLINAISRGEIEKYPQNVHTLQVEQEIEGDDVTVLQHILGCDVERTELLEQMEELTAVGDDEMTEAQKAESAASIAKVTERLELIDA